MGEQGRPTVLQRGSTSAGGFSKAPCIVGKTLDVVWRLTT